jgi:menaquinone-dependent protoporphyrinogen oxidase
MKILVAYATMHGSTGEVGEFIGHILRAFGGDVTVANVNDVKDISGFDALVVGSAVQGGLWHHDMCAFTDRFQYKAEERPSFFFITCIRALEPNGYAHAQEYYIDHRAINHFNVHDIAVFTGKLRTDQIDRKEVWYLAANYDGKRAPGLIKDDFRDWETIATWTISIAKDLKLVPTFEQPELVSPAL